MVWLFWRDCDSMAKLLPTGSRPKRCDVALLPGDFLPQLLNPSSVVLDVSRATASKYAVCLWSRAAACFWRGAYCQHSVSYCHECTRAQKVSYHNGAHRSNEALHFYIILFYTWLHLCLCMLCSQHCGEAGVFVSTGTALSGLALSCLNVIRNLFVKRKGRGCRNLETVWVWKTRFPLPMFFLISRVLFWVWTVETVFTVIIWGCLPFWECLLKKSTNRCCKPLKCRTLYISIL